MPTLYSLHEGVLAELEPEIDRLLTVGLPAPDEDDDDGVPERERALFAAIERRWTFSPGLLGDLIFWRDESVVLDQVRAVAVEAADLLGALLDGDVVGIRRWEFGFVGSLTAAEVARLVALLAPVVGPQAAALQRDRSRWDDPVDPADPWDAPARVLAGLTGVTAGRDIALRLG